jgi:outer membrane protein assembly factor BamB
LHDGFSVDPEFSAPLGLAWSTTLNGSVGYPLIADDRVFVMLSRPDENGNHVEALSLTTGEVLWGPVSVGGAGFQQGTIAYDRGRVFAINFHGQLTALDAETGAVAWRTVMEGQYAFTSPPTAKDGRLYLAGSGSGSTLYAVDEESGETLWASDVGVGDYTAPVVDPTGIYLSGACEMTYRFLLDGTFVWRHEIGCSGGGGRTAVLHDGLLYVREPSDPFFSTPKVLDAETGHVVGTFHSELVPAIDEDDHIATVSAGVLSVASTTATSPTAPSWTSAESDFITAPLIVNHYVVAGRSPRTLEVRDVDDGTVVWSDDLDADISASNEGGDYRTLTGLAEGGGTIVVPAGSTVNAFVPVADLPFADATATLTDAPAPGAVTGRSAVVFGFVSSVGGARFVCTTDGHTEPCRSPVVLQGLDDGPHDFSVAVVGSSRPAASRGFVVDAVAPVVALDRFHRGRTRAKHVTVHWSATDARSGVTSYQLEVQRSRLGKAPSPWAIGPATSALSAVLPLPPATRLCVSVRALDGVGNWSGWSPPSCVERKRVRTR